MTSQLSILGPKPATRAEIAASPDAPDGLPLRLIQVVGAAGLDIPHSTATLGAMLLDGEGYMLHGPREDRAAWCADFVYLLDRAHRQAVASLTGRAIVAHRAVMGFDWEDRGTDALYALDREGYQQAGAWLAELPDADILALAMDMRTRLLEGEYSRGQRHRADA